MNMTPSNLGEREVMQVAGTRTATMAWNRSVLITLPAVARTPGMRRKPVLLVALAGFLVANAVMTVSGDIRLSYVARFVAGAFSALLWGMLAGYARRITSPARAGRALAVASIGTPPRSRVGLAQRCPSNSILTVKADTTQ